MIAVLTGFIHNCRGFVCIGFCAETTQQRGNSSKNSPNGRLSRTDCFLCFSKCSTTGSETYHAPNILVVHINVSWLQTNLCVRYHVIFTTVLYAHINQETGIFDNKITCYGHDAARLQHGTHGGRRAGSKFALAKFP